MVKGIISSHKLGKKDRQLPKITNGDFKTTSLTHNCHDISNEEVVAADK